MNINQKENILKTIQSILEFDIDSFIIQNNTTGNADDILFSNFKASEFKALYKRAMKQLKNELENGLGLLLPNSVNTGTEYNNIDLGNTINTFFSYLSTFPHKDLAGELLKAIIYYQILLGFWDKSKLKVHDSRMLKAQGLESKIELLYKDLEQRISILNENIEKKSDLEKSFNDILVKYNSILNELEGKEFYVNEKANSVDFILGKTQKNEQFIDEVYEKSKKELIKIREDKEMASNEFSQLKTDLENLKGKIENLEETNKKLLDELKISHENILAKEKDINKLVGLAADGTLGYKFDERNKDLSKNTRNWAISSFISVIVTVIWIGVVFKYLSTDANIVWLSLLINTIKTSPGWFLIAFCVNQYKKERTYQEQYAFKSSIAMTLTSYVNMLSDSPEKEITIKDSLLLQAVNSIYKEPAIEKEQENIPEKAIEKAKELLSSTAEIVKNINSK